METPITPVPESQPTPKAVPATKPARKYPVGIIIIMVYYGFAAISGITVLFNPRLVMGYILVTGLPAFAFYFVQFAVHVIAIWGFLKKLHWAKTLTISLQISMGIWATLSCVLALLNKEEALITYKSLMAGISASIADSLFLIMLFGGLVYSWVVTAAIVTYLLMKKEYFRR